MTKDEQEEYIDEQLLMFKTQMMKMPDTIPVLLVASTSIPGIGGRLALFINSLFKDHFQEILSDIVRGDMPIDTNLFSPGDPREGS